MNRFRHAIPGFFLTLALGLTLAAAPVSSLRADEVAVFTLQVGKSKEYKTFAVEFYEGDAPGTVANFKELVRKKFYKGLHIHRIAPEYLVQLGDPESKDLDSKSIGTNGPGYTLPPEIRRNHEVGTIAMARLPDEINPGRRSNGSQFYISLAPMKELDGKYTVFGKVVSGLDTLTALSAQGRDTNDRPVEPVKVRSVQLVERATLGAEG